MWKSYVLLPTVSHQEARYLIVFLFLMLKDWLISFRCCQHDSSLESVGSLLWVDLNFEATSWHSFKGRASFGKTTFPTTSYAGLQSATWGLVAIIWDEEVKSPRAPIGTKQHKQLLWNRIMRETMFKASIYSINNSLYVPNLLPHYFIKGKLLILRLYKISTMPDWEAFF